MSLPITIPDDYIGYYKIAQSSNIESQLALYITKYEEFYGRLILGDEIWSEITAQVSLDTKYVDLIDGNTYTDTDGKVRINKGFKDVLKGFIYYHYVGDNFINTTTGSVRNHNENSMRLMTNQYTQVVNTRFNNSSMINDSDIWTFINNYDELSDTIFMSTEVFGTYTIEVANTFYLEENSIVTIAGVDYVATNIVTDFSFDIQADTGLIFDGLTYSWKPFFNICQFKVGYAL